MANFADVVWNAAQYKLPEIMQRPEFKHKPSTTLMTLKQGGAMLVPASERERVWNVKTSDSQTVEISTLNKQSTSAVTVRNHAASGNNNDGTKTTLSFVTRGRTFKNSVKQGDKSVFSLAEALAVQLRSAAIDLHGTLETYFLGLLNTNKTQVAVSLTPKSGSWDATNYLFQIANANKDRAFQKVRGFMREQYYQGELSAIVDEYFMQEAEHLIQQGQGNSTNLGWQFNGLNLGVTEELTTDAGYNGMGYVFPSGTVGFIDWIPSKNREGFGNTFQLGGRYRSMPDPLGSGLVFAVHELAAGADNSATYGESQDIDIVYEITIDVAFLKAPMSTSNLSPIVKFGLLES